MVEKLEKEQMSFKTEPLQNFNNQIQNSCCGIIEPTNTTPSPVSKLFNVILL